MCFSAPASFASSIVIGGLGVSAIVHTKKRHELVFAAIPLIFAVQQGVEGFLWLALGNASPAALPLTYLSMFFALWWWPLYVPFSAWLMEKNTARKKLLLLLAACGAIVGSLLYIIFLQNPMTATINNRCIYYTFEIPYRTWFLFFYSLATIGPMLISTKRIVRVFCALLLVSGIISAVMYYFNFISVWCFFAAIISAVIYLFSNRPSFQE